MIDSDIIIIAAVVVVLVIWALWFVIEPYGKQEEED